MPSNTNENHTFLVSFKDFLVEICKGVAEAQQMLDDQSINLLEELYTNDNNKVLLEHGIEPTWYHIPELKASLKVSISAQEHTEESGKKQLIKVSPYNARYKNTFDYDFNGSSNIEFKVVPIPPPIQALETTIPDLSGKTLEEAKDIIKKSKLILDSAVEVESEEPAGIVISQSPKSGTTVKIGDLINLEISK